MKWRKEKKKGKKRREILSKSGFSKVFSSCVHRMHKNVVTRGRVAGKNKYPRTRVFVGN